MARAWKVFTAAALALLAACGVQLLVVANQLEDQAALIAQLRQAQPASLVRSLPPGGDPGLARVELGTSSTPPSTGAEHAEPLPMPTVRLVAPTAYVEGPTMQATLPTLPVLPTVSWPSHSTMPTPAPTPTPPGA